ncbi:unnamed protein product [Rotaria sp. Silwood1]|nr:unnamed protein product [Rotaria sp. Silwood1]
MLVCFIFKINQYTPICFLYTVLSCRDLPKMDYFGTADPYVILELLPSTLYPERPEENKTSTMRRTRDPEFNQLFKWYRLPMHIIRTPGAVLRLSVWDRDVVTEDEFIGECFIPLMNIESLEIPRSIRDIPVSKVPLRRENKNAQPRVYELIRNRAKIDREAALFIKQRTRVMKSENRTGDENSISSFSRTALRSLVCCTPCNICFGCHSTAHNESDA